MADPRKIALLVLAAALLAPPALAADPVSIRRSVVYYDIGGETAPDIARSIRRNRPPQTAGFAGLTAYTFSWTYDYALGSADCQVSGAKVVIEIVVYMPRHSTIRRAPEAIRNLWKHYAVALKRHEDHHANDFIVTGSAIPAAIDAVHTPDCSTIEANANAIGHAYVARAQATGDAYDALTDHGMNEGAQWPGL